MTIAQNEQASKERAERIARRFNWLAAWYGIAILWVITWGGHLAWCLIPGLARWLGLVVFALGCVGAGVVFSTLWQRHHRRWPLVIGLVAWVAAGWSLVWLLVSRFAGVGLP